MPCAAVPAPAHGLPVTPKHEHTPLPSEPALHYTAVWECLSGLEDPYPDMLVIQLILHVSCARTAHAMRAALPLLCTPHCGLQAGEAAITALQHSRDCLDLPFWALFAASDSARGGE